MKRRRKSKKLNQKLKDLSLEKSNSVILLLDEEGEPLTRIKRIKLKENNTLWSNRTINEQDFLERTIEDGKCEWPPRFFGEITTRNTSLCLGTEGKYHIFVKARMSKTKDLFQLLLCSVKLSETGRGSYKYTARHRCGISKDENPWDKLKRMRKADKDTFRSHELWGPGKDEMLPPQIIKPSDKVQYNGIFGEPVLPTEEPESENVFFDPKKDNSSYDPRELSKNRKKYQRL